MFTVYILRNPDGLFYKGVTANLPQRIIDHNSGKSRYTKNKGPWELVWSKVVDSKREALIEEKRIKKLNHESLKRLING